MFLQKKMTLNGRTIYHPILQTSQFIVKSTNAPFRADRAHSFFAGSEGIRVAECKRCGHRCNIFMLWTGRVRAINSGGAGGWGWTRETKRVGGAVGWGARRGQSDYVSQTPRSLVRPSHRYHHPPPFYSLRPPHNTPWSCPPPRLLVTSSHRTLYGARTTLFVCFQPVCARTRRYAISVSGMRAAGPTTGPRTCMLRIFAYSYDSYKKKKDIRSFRKAWEKSEQILQTRDILENSDEVDTNNDIIQPHARTHNWELIRTIEYDWIYWYSIIENLFKK